MSSASDMNAISHHGFTAVTVSGVSAVVSAVMSFVLFPSPIFADLELLLAPESAKNGLPAVPVSVSGIGARPYQATTSVPTIPAIQLNTRATMPRGWNLYRATVVSPTRSEYRTESKERTLTRKAIVVEAHSLQ